MSERGDIKKVLRKHKFKLIGERRGHLLYSNGKHEFQVHSGDNPGPYAIRRLLKFIEKEQINC